MANKKRKENRVEWLTSNVNEINEKMEKRCEKLITN